MAVSTAELIDKLPRLIERLRRHDYAVGADETIKAHQLILGPAFGNFERIDEDSLRQLQFFLGPVFCQTPEQQQRFPAYFQDWLRQLPRFQQQEPSEPEQAPAATAPHAVSSVRKVIFWVLLLIAAAFLVSRCDFQTPDPVAPPISDKPIQGGESGEEVNEEDKGEIKDEGKQEDPGLLSSWLASADPQLVLGILALLSLVGVIAWLRRPQITRGETEGLQDDSRFISDDIDVLQGSAPLRKSVQQLRQHEQIAWRKLDVPASIRATIDQGGLFHPVYGTRPQMPEYLLLIETASLNDLQTAVAQHWCDYLVHQGLVVTPFWYAGAPWEWMVDEQGHRVSWLQLQSQYSQYRLLVLGDAGAWFDPFTGSLSAGAQGVHSWEKRALLTPRSVTDWDQREWKLQQAGLTPFYRDEAGVGQLVKYWEQDLREVEYFQSVSALPWPAVLEEYQAGLAGPESSQALVEALRVYLGDELFRLLCATALYPECHYGITRLLARHYLGDMQSLGDLEVMQRLARLPWMRSGIMPDWLRLSLLRQFPRAELNDLRLVLGHILDQGAGSGPGVELRRYLAPRSRLERAFRRWLGDKDMEALTHDGVFVKTMIGVSPLRVAAEASVSSLGNRGIRNVLPVALAVLVGAVGMLSLFDPQAWIDALVPVLSLTVIAWTSLLFGLFALGLWGFERYRGSYTGLRRWVDGGLVLLVLPYGVTFAAQLMLWADPGAPSEGFYPLSVFLGTTLMFRLFLHRGGTAQSLGLPELLQALRTAHPAMLAGAAGLAGLVGALLLAWVNGMDPRIAQAYTLVLDPTAASRAPVQFALDLLDALRSVLVVAALSLVFRRNVSLSFRQCGLLALAAGCGHFLFQSLADLAALVGLLDELPRNIQLSLTRETAVALGTCFGLGMGASRLGLVSARWVFRATPPVVLVGVLVTAAISSLEALGAALSEEAVPALLVHRNFSLGITLFLALAWFTRRQQILWSLGRCLVYIWLAALGIVFFIAQLLRFDSSAVTVYLAMSVCMLCLHVFLFRWMGVRQLKGTPEVRGSLEGEPPQYAPANWLAWLLTALGGLALCGPSLSLGDAVEDTYISIDYFLVCLAAVLCLRHGRFGYAALLLAPIFSLLYIGLFSILSEEGLIGDFEIGLVPGSWCTAWLVGRAVLNRDEVPSVPVPVKLLVILLLCSISVHYWPVASVSAHWALGILSLLLCLSFGYRATQLPKWFFAVLFVVALGHTLGSIFLGGDPYWEADEFLIASNAEPSWFFSLVLALLLGRTLAANAPGERRGLLGTRVLLGLMVLNLVTVSSELEDGSLYIWGDFGLAYILAALLGYLETRAMRWVLASAVVLILVTNLPIAGIIPEALAVESPAQQKETYKKPQPPSGLQVELGAGQRDDGTDEGQSKDQGKNLLEESGAVAGESPAQQKETDKRPLPPSGLQVQLNEGQRGDEAGGGQSTGQGSESLEDIMVVEAPRPGFRLSLFMFDFLIDVDASAFAMLLVFTWTGGVFRREWEGWPSMEKGGASTEAPGWGATTAPEEDVVLKAARKQGKKTAPQGTGDKA